ncbi:MAG: diguanylate cyclase domain-containing protein [Acidimicrobiales bacterium]
MPGSAAIWSGWPPHGTERLSRAIRTSDTLARIGGDEFVVVLTHLSGEEDATAVADKLLAQLDEPLAIADPPVRVSASIGIALSTGPGPTSYPELLRRADDAMYRAKAAGGRRWAAATGDDA